MTSQIVLVNQQERMKCKEKENRTRKKNQKKNEKRLDKKMNEKE